MNRGKSNNYICDMQKTVRQYNKSMKRCTDLFIKKTKDYGTAWRILRPSSLTDQLYIKAARIRSIEEKGVQKVDDPLEGDFIGLVNYSAMALVQLKLDDKTPLEMKPKDIEPLFIGEIEKARDLMLKKNHDYGEAWREMRISSFTDLILQKLLRIKQIEGNSGKTIVSEGIEAGYQDIINYAMFALIKFDEGEE